MIRLVNKIIRWFGIEKLEVGYPFGGYDAKASTTYRVQLSMPSRGNSEINFRVWDKKTKKMYPVKSVIFSGQQYAEEKLPAPFRIVYPQVQAYYLEKDPEHPLSSPTDKSFFLTDFELMQFTGFQDKNGRDIYVGDILESNAEQKEVVCKDGCFKCKIGKHFPILSEENRAKCEIVGNIYEK